MVRLGYNLILKTGLFEQACQKWRDKPQADRTMIHFKKHFKKWEKDRHLMLTTGAAGYHGANHIEAPPAPAADAPLDKMGELRAQLREIQVASPAAPAAAAARRPAAVPIPLAEMMELEMGYCWTHGYRVVTLDTPASVV
eukprot:scaffold11894_cov53-Attheya_sp.AAC.6